MNKIIIAIALVVCFALPTTSYAVKGDASGFTSPYDGDSGEPVKGPWNVPADQDVVNDMLNRQDTLINRGAPIQRCMKIPNKLQQNDCLAKVITDLRKEINLVIDDSIATCRRMVQGKKACITSLKHAKDSTGMYLADMTLPFAFEGTDFEQLHMVDMFILTLRQWERVNAAMKLN